MSWRHGHTFTAGLLAGLTLALHPWLLLGLVTAGAALGFSLVYAGVSFGRWLGDRFGRRVRA
jgi:membrane protein DedA with SNARE-associated domain